MKPIECSAPSSLPQRFVTSRATGGDLPSSLTSSPAHRAPDRSFFATRWVMLHRAADAGQQHLGSGLLRDLRDGEGHRIVGQDAGDEQLLAFEQHAAGPPGAGWTDAGAPDCSADGRLNDPWRLMLRTQEVGATLSRRNDGSPLRLRRARSPTPRPASRAWPRCSQALGEADRRCDPERALQARADAGHHGAPDDPGRATWTSASTNALITLDNAARSRRFVGIDEAKAILDRWLPESAVAGIREWDVARLLEPYGDGSFHGKLLKRTRKQLRSVSSREALTVPFLFRRSWS